MDTQTRAMSSFAEYTQPLPLCELPVHGPIQFLILDKVGGPAEMVLDIFGKLFNFGVSSIVVSTADEAWYALHCYKFDLLVVGLEGQILETLALLPEISKEYPDLPVMGIGRNLCPFHIIQSQQFGLDNIVDMPQRATGLKALLRALIQRYLLEK